MLKRKRLRKLLCFGTVTALVCSLAACGGKENGAESRTKTDGESVSADAAGNAGESTGETEETTDAGELVYAYEEILPELQEWDYIRVEDIAYLDGQILVLIRQYASDFGEASGELTWEDHYFAATCDEDGGGYEAVELELPTVDMPEQAEIIYTYDTVYRLEPGEDGFWYGYYYSCVEYMAADSLNVGTEEYALCVCWKTDGSIAWEREEEQPSDDEEETEFFSDTQGIWVYESTAGYPTLQVSFIDLGLYVDSAEKVVEMGEERYLCWYTAHEDGSDRLAIFEKKAAEGMEKIRVVLGCYSLTSDLRDRIYAFNAENDTYKITVKTYETYADREELLAGYSQLNMDIINGEMPDILVADEFPISNYISMGFIADIGALIEADEELSKIEYLENIFDAYSVDGVLYYVIPSFSVTTAIGKTTLVGERAGWTMAEFLEVLSSLPEGTEGFDISRSWFMKSMLEYNGTYFVDAENGTCSFDSEEFVQFLEYAATLPEEVTYSWDSELAYRNETTLLKVITFSSFYDAFCYEYGYFGEGVSWVGVPNGNRTGSVCYASTAYVLSALSDEQTRQGAWEFVRYYLTEEYQNSITSPFPVSKSALEALGAAAQSTGGVIWNIAGEDITIPAMTAEQTARITEILTSVNRRAYSDETVEAIIEEETAAFFGGQKTAREAARFIQNRAAIYLSE